MKSMLFFMIAVLLVSCDDSGSKSLLSQQQSSGAGVGAGGAGSGSAIDLDDGYYAPVGKCLELVMNYRVENSVPVSGGIGQGFVSTGLFSIINLQRDGLFISFELVSPPQPCGAPCDPQNTNCHACLPPPPEPMDWEIQDETHFLETDDNGNQLDYEYCDALIST